MPTRRTLELIVIAGVALRPVFALGRVWSHKTVVTAPQGSVMHGIASIGTVVF
jgi:hypothetical protein